MENKLTAQSALLKAMIDGLRSDVMDDKKRPIYDRHFSDDQARAIMLLLDDKAIVEILRTRLYAILKKDAFNTVTKSGMLAGAVIAFWQLIILWVHK